MRVYWEHADAESHGNSSDKLLALEAKRIVVPVHASYDPHVDSPDEGDRGEKHQWQQCIGEQRAVEEGDLVEA